MRPLKLQTTRAGIVGLIDDLIASGGTDAHLKVPGRPLLRIDERLVPTHYDALAPEDVQHLARAILEVAHEEVPLAALRDLNIAFGVEGRGRFRAQISRQRGSLAIVIHRIATDPPSLASLGLGDEVQRVIENGHGLVLVGGSRQRQAVMAAIVRHYNQTVFGHLVSIEDPVDFLHRDGRASVTQREVGQDVASFREGLLAAMRQDPDAIAVSDVPDAGDAELVLRAAEEGLLVIAGLPTPDGVGVVKAFARRFHPHREEEISTRVAAVLHGTIVVPRTGDARFSSLPEDRDSARANVAAAPPRLVAEVG